MTLPPYLRWLVEILLTNDTETMNQSENKQLAGYILAACIDLAPSFALLAGFAVQSLLTVLLCQLASTEGSPLEYGCPWYHLRTLRKYLGRQG